MVTIRPAQAPDHERIARLWHRGWHDAHAGIVPEAILAFRAPHHFRLWLRSSADLIQVAEREGSPIGFVATRGPELTRLYVAAEARGTGAARALLGRGEAEIARSGARDGVLLCTAGNVRAQRVYEREGWHLLATGPARLWLPPGERRAILALTHRYGKRIG